MDSPHNVTLEKNSRLRTIICLMEGWLLVRWALLDILSIDVAAELRSGLFISRQQFLHILDALKL